MYITQLLANLLMGMNETVFFEELENNTVFTNAYGMPFEKVEMYVAINQITKRAQHYNAISLWDFEECFFRDDECVNEQ